MKEDQLRDAVHEVISLLVRGEYAKIALVTKGVRLSAEEIETAVTDYGRTLVLPPEDGLNLDVIHIRNAFPPRYSVVVTLWTKEEGRSDLSLELTMIDAGDHFVIELDNLHVR